MRGIRAEQILQIRTIVLNYKNLECNECAQAIKDYLINQGIHGKHIKLYTGAAIGRNCYIYDDSVPDDAISVNGRHQAIILILNELEMVFDNPHPEGIPKNQWMKNLQFYAKIHSGCQFEVTEEEF